MNYMLYGEPLDPEEFGWSLAKAANKLRLRTDYDPELSTSAINVWQGTDEDGDPTKVFRLNGLWYAIYHDTSGWDERNPLGWSDADLTERLADGWTQYVSGSPVRGPETVPDGSQAVRLSDGGLMSEFDGGGVRSSDDGKPNFSLLMVTDLPYDEQVLTRAAIRMAEGAKAYGELNHEKMNTPDALRRCKASLIRHTMQYLAGETDEDHLAAILCNIVMVSGIEKRVQGE